MHDTLVDIGAPVVVRTIPAATIPHTRGWLLAPLPETGTCRVRTVQGPGWTADFDDIPATDVVGLDEWFRRARKGDYGRLTARCARTALAAHRDQSEAFDACEDAVSVAENAAEMHDCPECVRPGACPRDDGRKIFWRVGA